MLLVEDDDNDVFFFKKAIRDAGIQNELWVVRDGQEAMDYLTGDRHFADRTMYPLPCLIILDLKMPRKTGIDVLRWLRREPYLNMIPVIVFSSSAQRDDVELAYRLGANGFVVKPSSVEKRLEFARSLKGYWLHFNVPPGICREEARTIAQPVV